MTTHTNIKRVGLLATGSELVGGEILNTNGQQIAQSLQLLGIDIGEHVVVDDSLDNLKAGLEFLLKRHDGVITIGGLGPTSDDCTRDIVAAATQQPLIFNEASWQRIVDRLAKRNIPIPEINKQQAFFPKDATIFPNVNGTADGCAVQHRQQWIFMLPGPPRECLPLFHNFVVPLLEQQQFTSNHRLYRWRLMGVSESAIAETLEIFGKPYQLQFGYRAHYPFVDIKLHLDESERSEAIKSGVYEIVSPYLVTTENSNLSTQLQHALGNLKHPIALYDNATKGAIAVALMTPQNHHALNVVYQPEPLPSDYAVSVEGLEAFWHLQPGQHQTEIRVTLNHAGKTHHAQQIIFLRGQETIQYAIEFVSWQILKHWIR